VEETGIWELEDLDLYELLALRDQSLMFVRLPDAISVWQYENNTDHSVSVRVEKRSVQILLTTHKAMQTPGSD
jgi:hypothetical protein